MTIYHNPDEWEVVSGVEICEFHKKNPGVNLHACTCSGYWIQRKKNPLDAKGIVGQPYPWLTHAPLDDGLLYRRALAWALENGARATKGPHGPLLLVRSGKEEKVVYGSVVFLVDDVEIKSSVNTLPPDLWTTILEIALEVAK